VRLNPLQSLPTPVDEKLQAVRELERSGAIKVDRRQIRIQDEEILSQWAQGPN